MLRLAWQLLLHDRTRFIVALAGVSVSVLLVLVQMGLYAGFLSTATMLFDHSGADLWVAPVATRSFDNSYTLSDDVFYRVRSTEGVESAERVALAFAQLRLREGGLQAIQVVGLEPRGRLLQPWSLVAGTADLAATPTAAVVDGSELEKLELRGIGDTSEVNGLRVRVVGLTRGIRTFTTAPLLFTLMSRARRYLSLPPDRFTFVMVKLSPGADKADVMQRLASINGTTTRAVHSMVADAQSYWAKLTGIGVTLGSMAAMAIVVGFVITAQILYNSTTQNMKEYATLKAMGAPNLGVLSLVFAQAAITALLGFALGAALACAARAALNGAHLVIALSGSLFVGTGLLTLAMCLVAALIPAWALLNVEPTRVLKG